MEGVYIENQVALDKYLELIKDKTPNGVQALDKFVHSLEEWEQATLMADCMAHSIQNGGSWLLV